MKRRIVQIVVLLLLGATVNVAVAWGCAVFIDSSASQSNETSSQFEFRYTWSQQGATRVLVRPISQLEDPVVPVTTAILSDGRGRVVQVLPPFDAQWIYKEIVGWPLQSLYSKRTPEDAPIPLPRSKRCTLERLQLPLSVKWPGFAINTIFYAAILWLIFLAPGKVRRAIRRRRGLCPACAYPIGISPLCTECGKPVSPKTSKQVSGP